jgi:hypothetical protein
MERGVELLAGIALLLTCLSHITAPGAWARLFDRIRASGDLAGLANAAIHLPLALIIVAFHNVWGGPGIWVTLIGWALLVKGTLQLLFPKVAQRSLSLAGEGEVAVRRYRLAGVLMLPLALFVLWIALR